ncbi:FAD synthase, partial [Stegodyphus mimosarum]
MLLRNCTKIFASCNGITKFIYLKDIIHSITLNRCNNAFREVTAGVLIIGDEILKGQIDDLNSSFLIKNLNLSGIKIQKLAILPDDVRIIAKEVSDLSKNCTVVLTSGGIGPTHDDVTFEAVSKACNEELQVNEYLSNLFMNYYGVHDNHNPAVLKFASIPKSATLHFGSSNFAGRKIMFPLISLKNIFMFPGVPILLQKGFKIFKSSFLLQNSPHFNKTIHITLDEFSITPLLNEAVQEFKGKVKFGSYPVFSNNYYKVKLTLESLNETFIQEAYNYFKSKLPPGSIVDLKADVLKVAKDDVYALSEHFPAVSSALAVIEEMLKVYSLSNICICFNGGKDCTALLHVLYSSVQKLCPNEWNHIRGLYVRNGETFQELENFVQEIITKYQLNLTVIEGDMKETISQYLKSHPQIKAVIMGTRRCDPGASELKYFSQTDSKWPPVMRILPLLDWSYNDVWSFIRNLQLPYCVLYDRGYTSLGIKSTSWPNPALLIDKREGYEKYKPAYTLTDIRKERSGRS